MKKIPYEQNNQAPSVEENPPVVDEMSPEDKKKADPWSNVEDILSQIKKERTLGIAFMRPKWDKWMLRLKLYNNQRRSKDAVGDPLLFTIHQTVLASLYTDKLSVEFQGRNEGDADQAENLTMLAQFDYEEMDKERLDYDWDWDTCFFGWSLMLFMEFDRESKTPIPEILDPFSTIRDPRAISPNGDRRGRGAARFIGREMRMCKYQMKDAEVYQNVDLLKAEDTNITNDPLQLANAQRQEAQGYTLTRNDGLTGDSADFILWEWFTIWNGEKWFFTVGNDGSTLVRAQKVRNKKWPLVKRNLFPIAHDWDGVSIPDLVEDKQRSRATLINLGVKGVRANLYPNYLYNNQLIKNKAALAKYEFNKFTGVAGNPVGAVAEIPRSHITNDVQWILGMLDASAQQATATPDIKQGVSDGKVRSATETAQVSQGVDSRYGLSAKVWGWSEKEMWKLWYENYTLYYTDIDQKVIRLSGALGPTWHTITKDDIIGEANPDVFIESKTVSDAKRMNRLNMDTAFMNQGVALDPSFNKRFALKNMGKDMGYTTDEINRYLPKTFDEYEAEQENKKLSDNKLPKISMSQNHLVHIETHTKAADTPAKQIHINQHYAMLWAAREQAAKLAEQTAQVAAANGESPQPTAGGPPNPQTGQQLSPMEQGTAPAPRDMAQSPLQLQAPNAVQVAH